MGDVNPFRRRRGDFAHPIGEDDLDPIGGELAAAGRGDEAAFGRFYDLVAPLVHGVVLKVVRDPAMAEEVAQETFVEIWRLAPRFDPSRGSAKSWSATIAHRRAVDRVRSEQSRRTREQRDHAQQVGAEHDSTTDVVIDRLDHARVRSALDALSDTQRGAVTLAYYDGRTYREVAALLDIPEGTAKTRIRDGLIRLRDHFGVDE